jgi:transcriptional regulatory protein RtcR
MKTVVIGLLGTTLDALKSRGDRWQQWRPTVDLCRQQDLVVDRLELLLQKRFQALAEIVVRDIQSVSPETEVRCHYVEFGDAWDFEQVYSALHDFARGYEFKTGLEQYLIHITTGTHVAQICEFLLTESRHFPARLIQTGPPQKPGQPGTYNIIDLDLSKYDRIASRFRQEQTESREFLKSGIPTRNAAFNKLIERIEHVAIASRAPLLLMGPTGAGKSQLARRIYELKTLRRQVEGRFVEVNCATIRGDGAMSALFGHTRGAFTGAVGGRDGLLREAHGGILFLDEIGELGLEEQAMLLRAVEDGKFFPVGSDREAESKFQLLSGTNRDLHDAVARGTFRDDLLARINLWTFRLPALRDRPEDMEPNLDYELARWTESEGRRVTFSKEARKLFLDFATAPAASRCRTCATSSSGSRLRGSARAQPSSRAVTRCSAVTSTPTRSPRSIASIACSSLTCSRFAPRRAPCPTLDASCSRSRASVAARRTTPTACESTSRGSRSPGLM